MDDDGPPGVPEWVVTYGDMMSLLLTFFIMLVSLSEVVADKKYRAILESARQHLGYDAAPHAPPGKNFPMNSILESLQEMKLGSVSDTDKGKGGIKHQAPPGLDMRVTRLREGESQPAGPAILFAAGSAELGSAGGQLIAQIAHEIAGKPHKLEIRAYSAAVIEGMPQSPQQRMKLAYQRARVVMQQMVADKVDPQRMRIVTFFEGSSVSEETQRTQSTDRVEITILDEYAESYIGREVDYRDLTP